MCPNTSALLQEPLLERKESSPRIRHGDGDEEPDDDLILPESSEYHHVGGHSSLAGATFNFTNSIIGAGAIGLGGAIAASGGAVSVVAILFFAVLTKLSLDLVVQLSVETPDAHGSYEDLAQVGFGGCGRMVAIVSKFLYSFGCLVAYVIVVKDNFAPAVSNLVYGTDTESGDSWLYQMLQHGEWTTWTLSAAVILPLCLLRDMTPLASLSAVSVVSMFCIVAIVVYLYIVNPHDEIRTVGGDEYENWFQVRPGLFECLGTFVFTFVSQHTVHLAYDSLKPELRTVSNWKKVSTYSITISTVVSLTIGVVVYMTFWQATQSDIFELYPAMPCIDLAKLLLCITMLLTFPLPFFTCRELVVVMLWQYPDYESPEEEEETGDSLSADLEENVDHLEQPLLETSASGEQPPASPTEPSLRRDESSHLSLDLSVLSTHAIRIMNWFLLEGEDRQLILPLHIMVTCKMWFAVTLLAIMAPSLGDVLDLVGCATGTIIAFILPACLAFKLQGYSHKAALILVVGGVVGLVGTTFSVKQLWEDVFG